MFKRRVLTASILFVLCGAIPAYSQDAPANPPSGSGLPDINGGTITPTIDPSTGAPSGDLLAPAATRPRAGVDLLVDRPSALASMATRPPATEGGSATPDGLSDLQARPSALTATAAPTGAQPTSFSAVAEASPDPMSRPRATVQANEAAPVPHAAEPIEIFALGRAPAAPTRQDGTGPVMRATPAAAPLPAIHGVLPTITVYADPPARMHSLPAKELAAALPAVPLSTRHVAETGRLPLHFDTPIRVSSPRVALYHQMAVALTPSTMDRVLPVVRLAVTRRRAPLPTIAIAVADLPIKVTAPRVTAELSAHTPVRVATPSDALGEAPLGRLAELTRAQPAGRALMASTNRAGLVPAWHADRTPPPVAAEAPTNDNSSSVDAVLAQVAVLERQVAVQRAANDHQAAQLAQENERLRQDRARLAQATRVAMEQYVATSPILQ